MAPARRRRGPNYQHLRGARVRPDSASAAAGARAPRPRRCVPGPWPEAPRACAAGAGTRPSPRRGSAAGSGRRGRRGRRGSGPGRGRRRGPLSSSSRSRSMRSARFRRQAATTRRCSSTDWSVPAGASSSSSAASKAANPAASSSARSRNFWARKPCLSAFWAERALPSWVLGPHDLAPLRRLASARALGRPKLGMTNSFAGREGGPWREPQDPSV